MRAIDQIACLISIAVLAVTVFVLWLKKNSADDRAYFAKQRVAEIDEARVFSIDHSWFRQLPEKVPGLMMFHVSYIDKPVLTDVSFGTKVYYLEQILRAKYPNLRRIEAKEFSHGMGRVTFATFKNPTPSRSREYY